MDGKPKNPSRDPDSDSAPARVAESPRKCKRWPFMAVAAIAVIVVAIVCANVLPGFLDPDPELPDGAIEMDMPFKVTDSRGELSDITDLQTVIDHMNVEERGFPFGASFRYDWVDDRALEPSGERHVYHASFTMTDTGRFSTDYVSYECDVYVFPSAARDGRDHIAVANISKGKKRTVAHGDYEKDRVQSPSQGSSGSGTSSSASSGSHSAESSASSEDRETCPSCGRKCSKTEIAWHGMCDRCYAVFQQANKLIGDR